jgi:hypothetical protein
MKNLALAWLLIAGFTSTAGASIPGVDQYRRSLCDQEGVSPNSNPHTNIFLKNKNVGWVGNPVTPGGPRVLVALQINEEADGSFRIGFSEDFKLSEAFKAYYRDLVDPTVRIKSCIVKNVAIYEIHGRQGFEQVLHAITVLDPKDHGLADQDRHFVLNFSGPGDVVVRSLRVSSPLLARAYNFDRVTMAAQGIAFKVSQPSPNQADQYAKISNEMGQQLTNALDVSIFKPLTGHWSVFPQLLIIRENP